MNLLFNWKYIYRAAGRSDLQSDFSPPFIPNSERWQAAYLRCQSQVQLSAGRMWDDTEKESWHCISVSAVNSWHW